MLLVTMIFAKQSKMIRQYLCSSITMQLQMQVKNKLKIGESNAIITQEWSLMSKNMFSSILINLLRLRLISTKILMHFGALESILQNFQRYRM